MRNLLIILLTLLVVIAGAFLPELLMNRSALPELKGDYQMVTVTAESSSDYAWRMERISEFYYGEAEHLLTTYISQEDPGDEETENHAQFLSELDRMVDAGVMPEEIRDQVAGSEEYHIRFYYLFDSEAVSGFRIAQFVASDRDWSVNLCMDVESGKLAKVEYSGSSLITGDAARPQGSSSWYDVLRSYAAYLGMSTSAIPEMPNSAQSSMRQYYDSCTADKWTGRVAAGSSAWMELRVLQESYKLAIAVYNGGK